MARTVKRNARRNPEETQDENPEEAPEVPELFRPSRDDSYVTLYRRDDNEKTWVYHGRLAASEASDEKVAELYGGGDFKLQLRERNDTGAFVIRQTRQIKLPGRYRPPDTLPNSSTRPATPAVVSGGDDSSRGQSPGEMLNMAMVAQLMDMMKSMSNRPTGPSVDWGVIVPAITGLLSTVLTAMLSRPKESNEELALMGERLARLTEEVQRVRNGPAEAQSNAMGQVISAVKDILEVKDMLESPTRGKADPMDSMIASLPTLLATMTGKPGAVPQPQQAAAPGPELPLWHRLLLSQKRAMLRSAMMGVNASFAAEVAVTYMPQELTGAMVEFVQRPDRADVAMQVIPELRSYERWVREFFDEGAKLLLAEDETDDTEVSGEVVEQEGAAQ